MPIHRIHLRGPWDVTGPWLDAAADGEVRSVAMPQRWRALFGSNSGTARFSRWFHQPTNLVENDRLAIVLIGVTGSGRAWLNEAPLGEFSAREESIRLPIQLKHLQHRNRLCIELTCPVGDEAGGLYDAVAIEIDSF